jgi:hypothetical protein
MGLRRTKSGSNLQSLSHRDNIARDGKTSPDDASQETCQCKYGLTLSGKGRSV